jgi:hypothetical protein
MCIEVDRSSLLDVGVETDRARNSLDLRALELSAASAGTELTLFRR